MSGARRQVNLRYAGAVRTGPATRVALLALAVAVVLGGASAVAEPRAADPDQSDVDDAQLSQRTTSRPQVRTAHRPPPAGHATARLDVVLPAVFELVVVAPGTTTAPPPPLARPRPAGAHTPRHARAPPART